MPEKAEKKWNPSYIANLSKSTTQEELKALFTQAGQVTAVEVIKARKRRASKGFGFVKMSAQSAADQAVSMFNTYSLSDHPLKVSMARPREQQVSTGTMFEP